MSPHVLKDLLAFPWTRHIEADPEGGFRLIVLGLADFELYAETQEELEHDWREALESHLAGYLRIGKAVPIPGDVTVVEPVLSGPEVYPADPVRLVVQGEHFALIG